MLIPEKHRWNKMKLDVLHMAKGITVRRYILYLGFRKGEIAGEYSVCSLVTVEPRYSVKTIYRILLAALIKTNNECSAHSNLFKQSFNCGLKSNMLDLIFVDFLRIIFSSIHKYFWASLRIYHTREILKSWVQILKSWVCRENRIRWNEWLGYCLFGLKE